MDNIIFFAGAQLSLVLLVVFQNGPCKILPLKFGPFRTKGDLQEWKEAFLDKFPKYCQKLPGVEECLKQSEVTESFDAADQEVIEPIKPIILAEELINMYFSDEEGLEEESAISWRYFDWTTTIQFDFPNQGSYRVERSYGPINDRITFRFWWRRFKKGVRKRAAQLNRIRFRVLKGSFIELGSFTAEEHEEDFYEITCWDPEMLAQELVTEVLKEWLTQQREFQS